MEGWEEDPMDDFTLIQDMTRGIRNVRAEYKVHLGHNIPCTISAGEKLTLVVSQTQTFVSLAGS